MEREGDMVREVRDGRGYMERARKRGGKEREGKQEREREGGGGNRGLRTHETLTNKSWGMDSEGMEKKIGRYGER